MKRRRKRISLTTRIAIALLLLALVLPSVRFFATNDWSFRQDGSTTVDTVEETSDTDVIADTDSDVATDVAVELEVATVVRVVDGDTLVVNVDGEEQYVRLIGIDAAESVHPDASKNTEEGKTASDHLKSMLSAGDTVYLQKDVSDTDKYDRLLRYVWLEMPSDVWDEDEVTSKMLNAILVAQGYADPVRYEPDTAYAEIFESL